ncbi:MAG: carboxypeptidase regulatory-like domain-containing protein [Bacteroidetes bacterium]|nr:carboxypeptidase regulatory-like domain-containing protein [Bacteroidota bacterium]
MVKMNFAGLFIALVPVMHSGIESIHKSQGIEGHVYRISGNQMPSPDVKPAAPKGIKTTVYIYDLTNLNQTIRKDQSPFYSAVKTNLVKKVETDSNGYFKVKLPVGYYSLFTKKDSLFYANSFDGKNNIAPVQVHPQKFSKVELKIDYDAYY